MKLYGCPNTRSMRAAWALEEAGAQYDYVLVDLFKGAARTTEFRAINPAAKLPVLVDGELTLTESAAIVDYIGGKYPASGLLPADAAACADCRRWMYFAVTELEQPLWSIAKHRFALPRERRVPAMEDTARWEFSIAAKLLEDSLDDRAYICDAQFTGADILLAHTLAWARSAKVPVESPQLLAYMERTLTRPALVRARERETNR